MNDIFREVEFKYMAGDTDSDAFYQWILVNLSPTRKLTVSGYDTYYSDTEDNYIRHRYNSDHAELTVKRRLSASSTASRVEVDLSLSTDQEDTVRALAGVLGYQELGTVYKTCRIAWLPEYNVVFYHVYNKKMQEQFRIIEIEATKGIDNPLEVIEQAEAQLGQVFHAIHPAKRLNVTMYELIKQGLV